MTTILECKKAFGIDEVLNVASIFFEKKLECRSWVIVIVVTVIIKVSFVDSLKGKGSNNSNFLSNFGLQAV